MRSTIPVNRRFRFTAVLLLIVVLMGGAKGRRLDYLDYSDSVDKTAVIVNEKELTLSDMAFYIAYEEQLVEKEAFIYNPQDTGAYWRIHTNGTYIRLAAKEAALNMAIHDEVFYQLAQENGIQLNDKEQQYAANIQADFWSDLPEGAEEKLGVNEEVLNRSIQKLAIARKYQYLLAEMNGVEETEYDVEGAQYQKLLETQKIKIIDEVWERVHFGSITLPH